MVFYRTDLQKGFVLVGSLGNQGHIVGSDILGIAVQSGRIIKMAFRTAQLGQLVIHHIHKGRNRTSYMLSQGIGCLIGRNKKKSVEAILYSKGISGDNAQFVSAVRFHTVAGGFCESNHFIRLRVFQNDQSSQNFGNAGRRVWNMDILSEENGSGIGVHNDSSFGLNSCISRPVRSGPGSAGKKLAGQQKAQ